MLASTWMDMVVGVDIHFEMVIIPPAPPVPTPFPNPFIGIVVDPAGLAIGLALGAALALATGGTPTGPVMINSMFATNVGTEAKGMGHILIPPGSMWVPMPKFPKLSFRGPPEFPGPPVKPEDDAVSIMGSTTVSVMGSSAVRMGEMWMSCGEPLRLPSSVVIAIPKGPLVLIGGPPGVNLMDALLGMIKTKWVAGYLHSLISRVKNARLRNILSKAACFLTGHPVDVASGRMLTDNVDFELPGPLPLKFERNYASSWSHRDGPLGPGWSHSLDQAVWLERGKIVYLADDGREIEFDVFDFPDHMLQIGQEVYEPINQLTLRLKSNELIEIETHAGETLEFAAPKTRDSGPRGYWWRLQKRRTRDRHEILLSYDERNNLQWVRDSGGRIIGFEHNADNRLTRVMLPHPSADGFIDYLRYFYDAEGDLIQVTDALGASWTFAYKRHLMVRETNRNGLSFYFAYDGYGSDAYCVRTWGDGGIYDHVIDYAKGQMTVVTNSLGHKTAYKLNPIGQVVEVIDARGGTTKYEYDERSLKKTKETDPLGNETKTEYDARGNVTKIVRADGGELLVRYSTRGLPEQAIDPIGGEWRWEHDQLGRVTGVKNPANERSLFSWGSWGPISFTDAAGQLTQLSYDENGNLTTLTEPNGGVTTWTYDRRGGLMTETDAQGNVSRRYRDASGRVIRLDDADGTSQDVVRDPEGNVKTSRQHHREVRFDYRGMNRLHARSEAGVRVEFLYDTEEQIVGVQNEHGLVYELLLDPAGALREERTFGQIKRSYILNVAGRVTEIQRPDGKRTRYTYDAAGRVVRAKHHDDSGEVFGYRLDGALDVAENASVKVVFERDLLGRVTREVQGDHWIKSTYDALGRRTQIRTSKGLVQQIRRDSSGRVVGLAATTSNASASLDPGAPNAGGTSVPRTAEFGASFQRDQLGFELQRSLSGGITARWQRDSLGRPLRHEIWNERGTNLAAKQYTWDGSARITGIIDAMSGPISYYHDQAGNLAQVNHADGRVDLRMPDAVGNLFKSTDRTDRRYGPSGELLEARDGSGVTRYEYDAEGNLHRKVEATGRVWLYEWNASGRLHKVMRPTGSEVTFEYDALGRRVAKRTAGRTTRWIWDGLVPIHEWVESDSADVQPLVAPNQDACDGEKALEALLAGRPAIGPPSVVSPNQQAAANEGTVDTPITWLFEPESFAPLGKIVGDDAFSIVTDHLGSPTHMFDARGTEVWAAQIDGYGELHQIRGIRRACPFRFPGQYEDAETGLYYNGYRYYDRAAGSYISQDPLRLAAGIRLYAYPGDPVLWFDPFGLVAAPASLPNTPGIYTITNGNTAYVGSAGIGQQGMAGRISDANHAKAQQLLAMEGTKVEFIPVDLGTAASKSDKNNILRKFEQAELDRVQSLGLETLNDPNKRIQALSKESHADDLVDKHGASAGEQKACS